MGKLLSPGLVVSFVNQKGGAGKSTFTALYSNWLFTEGKKSGLRVAVVDCDNQQSTLASAREREMESSDKKEEDLYKMLQIKSQAFTSRLETLQDAYDIILVDLPGNMEQEGVRDVYHTIDVAFVPFKLDEANIDGTLKFWEKFKKVIPVRTEAGFNTTVVGIANDVEVRTSEYNDLADGSIKAAMPFEMLDVFIRHRADYKRFSTVDFKEDKLLNEVFEKLTEIITSHI